MAADVYVLRGLVVVTFVELLVYAFVMWRPLKLRLASLRETCRIALRAFGSWRDTDKQVERLMWKSRFKRHALLNDAMLATFAIMMCVSAYNLDLASLFWMADDVAHAAWQGVGVTAIMSGWPLFLVFFSPTLLVKASPRLQTQRSYSLLYVFIVTGTTSLLAFSPREDYDLYFMWNVFTNMLWACADGRVLLPIILSAFLFVAHAVIYTVRFEWTEVTAGGLGSGSWELVVFLLLLAITVTVNKYYVFIARTTLASKECRTGKAVAFSLLSRTCDAVVHLTSMLDISEHSPKLGALLLRSSSLEGIRFADLFHEREEICLQNTLDPLLGESGFFHLQLRDSDGNRVPVQVHYVKGLDVDDQPFYLLGIKEADPVPHDVPGAETMSTDGLSISYGISSISEADCSSSEDGSNCNMFVEDEEIAIWFQPFTGRSEVERYTTAFRSCFGYKRKGRPLSQCIKPLNANRFEKWLQHALNVLLGPGVIQRSDADATEATFDFRGRRGVGKMKLAVRLDLDMSDEPCDDASSGSELELAKLTMREVKQPHAAKSQHSSNQLTSL